MLEYLQVDAEWKHLGLCTFLLYHMTDIIFQTILSFIKLRLHDIKILDLNNIYQMILFNEKYRNLEFNEVCINQSLNTRVDLTSLLCVLGTNVLISRGLSQICCSSNSFRCNFRENKLYLLFMPQLSITVCWDSKI